MEGLSEGVLEGILEGVSEGELASDDDRYVEKDRMKTEFLRERECLPHINPMNNFEINISSVLCCLFAVGYLRMFKIFTLSVSGGGGGGLNGCIK